MQGRTDGDGGLWLTGTPVEVRKAVRELEKWGLAVETLRTVRSHREGGKMKAVHQESAMVLVSDAASALLAIGLPVPDELAPKEMEAEGDTA